MCRSIKTLFNFDPPATDDEIHAASLQFVRKLSGFNAPSRANQAVFDRAVHEAFHIARDLVDSLITNAPGRSREEEAAKAKARAALRFGAPHHHEHPREARPSPSKRKRASQSKRVRP